MIGQKMKSDQKFQQVPLFWAKKSVLLTSWYSIICGNKIPGNWDWVCLIFLRVCKRGINFIACWIKSDHPNNLMNALVNIWCEAIQVSPLHSAYQLNADTQVLYRFRCFSNIIQMHINGSMCVVLVRLFRTIYLDNVIVDFTRFGYCLVHHNQ